MLGFKPTENAVSLFGHLPGLPEPEYTALRHLASAGPIARSFADLRLLFDIVRGPDPRDPKITPVLARTSLSGNKLRVAVLQPGLSLQLEAEYAQCYAKFLERLGTPRQTGAGDPQIELVDFQQTRPPAARRRRPPGAEQIFPLSFAGWMRALTERDAWIAVLEAGFAGGFDVLIAPVSGTAAGLLAETQVDLTTATTSSSSARVIYGKSGRLSTDLPAVLACSPPTAPLI